MSILGIRKKESKAAVMGEDALEQARNRLRELEVQQTQAAGELAAAEQLLAEGTAPDEALDRAALSKVRIPSRLGALDREIAASRETIAREEREEQARRSAALLRQSAAVDVEIGDALEVLLAVTAKSVTLRRELSRDPNYYYMDPGFWKLPPAVAQALAFSDAFDEVGGLTDNLTEKFQRKAKKR